MDCSYPSQEAVHCPTGYRFVPTDDEVIEHFLLKKVLGRPLTPNRIQELDIFRYDPEQLPLDIDKEAESCGYFFVHGKLGDEEGGGDCVRTTPGGYWKVKGTENIIMDREKKETIGFMRKMVFYRGKAPVGNKAVWVKTVWVLREYRLNRALSQLKDPHDTKMDNCVICYVYKKKIHVGSDW